MPWVLEVLTPVFIGSGQEPASPLDFLIEGNGSSLRLVPMEDLIQTLDDPEPFVQWIERQTRPSLQEMLNQPWAEGLRTKVPQYPALPLFTTQSPEAIREVARFLRDGRGRPYIPGSSIKGALRMALLYDFLIESPSHWTRLLKDMNQEEAKAKQRSRNFHAGEWLERRVFRGTQGDATRDLLRALCVTDSAPIRKERFFVGQITLVGSRRELSIYVEALSPRAGIEIRPIETQSHQEILDMMNEQLRLWEDRLTELYRNGWPTVARACYRWSQDLLEAEVDHWQWLHQQGSSIAGDVISRLQSLQGQNQEDRPILRIGMHRGALSLTIGLAIRKTLGNQSEEYSRWAQRVVRGRRSVGAQFPKTRKAIYYQGQWWPFGWVRIGPAPSQPTGAH